MIWPLPLIAELAERRAILILGAGASATAVGDAGRRPKTWRELLEAAMGHISSETDKEAATRYISEGRYLDAAEIIFSDMETAVRRSFFRDELLAPKYKPSKIHEVVRDLDSKIVITTNYDTLYEDLCHQRETYSVRRYTESGSLLDEIRSPSMLIIKAHGCVTGEADKLVISRSDYFRARQDHSQFYAVLESLVTVNTCLFVGYSLSDPDVQLVLENRHIATPSNHTHYALMAQGTHPAIAEATLRTYNVRILEYSVSDMGSGEQDHSQCITALEDLSARVTLYREEHRA